MRAALLFLWVLLLAGPAAAQPADAQAAQAGQTIHLESADLLVAPGGHFAPPPARVDERALAGAWTKVALPHVLPRPLADLDEPRTGEARPSIVAWFRVPLPALSGVRGTRSLYLPRWKSDGQLAIYVDGRMVWHSHANIDWNGWNIPLLIPLDDVADPGPLHTLLIRLERPANAGGGISTLWVGSETDLAWRYRLRYFLQVQLPYTSSAAFLAVGLFSFCVWLRVRDERTYLLFFCISVTSFLRTLHYHVGSAPLPVSDQWFSWLTVNSLYWTFLISHLFLQHLHRRALPAMTIAASALTLAMGLITMPLDVIGIDSYDVAPLSYGMLLLIGTTLAVTNFVLSRRSGSRDALVLSSWGLFGMGFGAYDLLLQMNLIGAEAIYLGPLMNIGAFVILMVILYRRYLQARQEVMDANANLQKRLEEREAELRASHEQLREIARQQTLSDERARLMQDMHDGMGSSLVSALMVVESGHTDQVALADVLKTCIDDLKLTIDSMEPVQADLLLLLATFRFRFATRLEQAGIRIRWEVTPLPTMEWIDPRNALHILRILQEAFTNIVKHARATEVRVATGAADDHVLVTIADNGVGMPQEQPRRAGKGLSNLKRRAAAIGGTIEIASSATGTTIHLRLPVRQATAA